MSAHRTLSILVINCEPLCSNLRLPPLTSVGHPEIVFILLNAGLSAKQKDSFSQTPLHSACIKGDIQCAEMLIENVSH